MSDVFEQLPRFPNWQNSSYFYPYGEGRPLEYLELELIALQLKNYVQHFCSRNEPEPPYPKNDFTVATAHERFAIGSNESRLERELKEYLASVTFSGEDSVEQFHADVAIYLEVLRAERAKYTPEKMLVQRHFMGAVAAVGSVFVGVFTRRTISFDEELFYAVAYARDALMRDWSPQTIRAYLTRVDELTSDSRYDDWFKVAIDEIESYDSPFETLEDLAVLRDEIEVLAIWSDQ